MAVPRVVIVTLAAVALLVFTPSLARAQQDDPVGPFVIDAHVALPSFSSAEAIAAGLGLRSDQLPERGLGFEIGAHVYPLRGRRVTLGLGASLVRARGRQKPSEAEPGEEVDPTEPTEPTIETQFSSIMPQVSLNFGSTRGWSYISGGYGWTRRVTGAADSTLPDGVNLGTVSYGGGARWFVSTHVAFSFDLRFYRLPAQTADTGVPASPGYTMFMGTAGISFK
jgi:hypothetical protein